MKIESRNGATVRLPWKELQWLQHPDLKDFTVTDFERLKAAVKKYGLIRGLNGWKAPDGTFFILDGCHLQVVLLALEKEGHQLPQEVDVHLKLCKDRQEAAEFVLLYSSIYARMTYEGLESHMHEFTLTPVDVDEVTDIPFLSMDYWKDLTPEDTGQTSGQMDAEAAVKYDKPERITFTFSGVERSLYYDSLQKIKTKYNFTTLTQVLKHLIKLETDADTDAPVAV
jgi:hypothetical protein